MTRTSSPASRCPTVTGGRSGSSTICGSLTGPCRWRSPGLRAPTQRQREAILAKAPLVPVLHAYAGMVFSGMTAAQALDNLEYLREGGVAVPARTIEAMRQEAEA